MKKLPLLLLVAIILTSCHTRHSAYRSRAYFSSSREMAPAYGNTGGNEQKENKTPERVVIYNAYVDLAIKN